MIIEQEKLELSKNGALTTASFGIDVEDMPHILDILRNKMYSDKILAVIREYSSNAFDAHKEAGITNRPIQISLPNELDQVLKIRDFGLGLSDQEITNLYVKYGKSTRRNSNEFVGALGFGCKAGFAYGDSFTITSIRNGTKNTYSAFIDPSKLGQVVKIASEPTIEESGIEIGVPVQYKDMDRFITTAADFFKYWEVKPEIKGYDPDEFAKASKDNDVVFSEAGWKYIGDDSGSVAIMGNVGYPINTDLVSTNSQLSRLLHAGLRLRFDIGELSVASSREALEYDDKTKKAIFNKLLDIPSAFKKLCAEKFAQCKNIWEAKKLFGKIMEDYSGEFFKIRELIRDCCLWDGIQIKSAKFPLNNYNVQCSRWFKHIKRSTEKIESQNLYEVPVYDNAQIIIHDLPGDTKVMNRVAGPLYRGSSEVFVLQFPVQDEWERFFKAERFDGVPFKLLSQMPVEKLSALRNPNMVKNAPSVRSKAKGFIFDKTTRNDHYNKNRAGNYWKIQQVDMQNDTGIYVPLEHFYWKRSITDERHPKNIVGLLQSLAEVGLNVDNLFGFREKTIKQLNKANWHSLDDVITKYLTDYITNNNIGQKIANQTELDNCESPWLDTFYRELNKFNQSGLMYSFLNAYKTIEKQNRTNKDLICKVRRICENYSVVIAKTPTFDLGTLLEGVEKRYPMLVFADDLGYNPTRTTSMIDYINFVDKHT
jgi:hypothetical protein